VDVSEAELRLDAEVRKELSSNGSSGTDKLTGRRAESGEQRTCGKSLWVDLTATSQHMNYVKNPTRTMPVCCHWDPHFPFHFLVCSSSHSVYLACKNALKLIVRSIEVFEHEVELNAKKDSAEEKEEKRPFLPSGARLYYLRGGILLSMQRYQDAIPHLQKALRHCGRWDGL
jgi:tetratricopeptide (TPR) repeat protein